ncbi:MAG: hypothetical protein JO127_04700 [Caulobacteraceae bacterium]|nr:hypothetical protein [Caulobacteraceae bacterium]
MAPPEAPVAPPMAEPPAVSATALAKDPDASPLAEALAEVRRARTAPKPSPAAGTSARPAVPSAEPPLVLERAPGGRGAASPALLIGLLALAVAGGAAAVAVFHGNLAGRASAPAVVVTADAQAPRASLAPPLASPATAPPAPPVIAPPEPSRAEVRPAARPRGASHVDRLASAVSKPRQPPAVRSRSHAIPAEPSSTEASADAPAPSQWWRENFGPHRARPDEDGSAEPTPPPPPPPGAKETTLDEQLHSWRARGHYRRDAQADEGGEADEASPDEGGAP